MGRKHSQEQASTRFVKETEPRLSYALAAAYGPEIGAEATADAPALAWENWQRIKGMANPAGYLFRVGQSRSRRYRDRGCSSRDPHRTSPRSSNLPCRGRSRI